VELVGLENETFAAGKESCRRPDDDIHAEAGVPQILEVCHNQESDIRRTTEENRNFWLCQD
jgi:hypothetical protein